MTDLSRRAMLAAGACAAALSPFLGAEAAHAAGPRLAYSRTRFRPELRRKFQLIGPGGRWSAKLTEVSDLSKGQAGHDQAFGLTFRTDRPGPEQGTFTVRHGRFAATSLFLVPTDPGRRTYYAVINRAPARRVKRR